MTKNARLGKRTGTRRGGPCALSTATRRLRRALELASTQRADLAITSATCPHLPTAERLNLAASLIGSLLGDAIELLDAIKTDGTA